MDLTVLWNAVGAIGSAAASILALGALLYSVRTFKKSVRLSHYEILDTMYWDLLKTGLDKPYLRNATASRNPKQQEEYEIYALMAWCVIETIFDRATPDNDLLDIWRSAIEIENHLHRQWFDRPDNEYKFRKPFREYIRKGFPAASASVPVKEVGTHAPEEATAAASRLPNTPMQPTGSARG